MKKPAILFIVFLILIGACALSVFAHSGRTDENGGHYDTSTGEYHYHHGYPAHDHGGGKCPYDFEDNIDHDRNNVSESNQNNSSTSNDLMWLSYVIGVCVLLPIPLGGLFVFRASLREYKQQPSRKRLYNLLFFSLLCLCCIAGFVINLIVIFDQ